MSEADIERFEATVGEMPDTSEKGGLSPEVQGQKSDLEKASEVLGMVEGLGGNPDKNMADLVESANKFASSNPVNKEASDEARIADAAGAFKILEGDADDTATTLGEQPEPPFRAALLEIGAADPSGAAVKEILQRIDSAERKEALSLPNVISPVALLLARTTQEKPPGTVRLAKLDYHIQDPTAILSEIAVMGAPSLEQREEVSNASIQYLRASGLSLSAPVGAGSSGVEAYDKTQRDRGFFVGSKTGARALRRVMHPSYLRTREIQRYVSMSPGHLRVRPW